MHNKREAARGLWADVVLGAAAGIVGTVVALTGATARPGGGLYGVLRHRMPWLSRAMGLPFAVGLPPASDEIMTTTRAPRRGR